MTARTVLSTCFECDVRCGALIHVEGDRVVKAAGNKQHPYSAGAFCAKGVHGLPTGYHHPDRVLHPLRRTGPRGSREWTRISWDEALDELADRLGDVKRRYGPLAIAGAVSSAYFSRGVAMQLLLRSLGSPNVMINQDLCRGTLAASDLFTGLNQHNGEEIAASRCVVLFGRNPSEAHILQWRQIKQAKQAGAKLIVVDPRRTAAADLADLWAPIRRGTDAAFALGMLNVIIQEDLYDHEFVERYCHGFAELAERAAQFPPERVAALTGVGPDVLIEVARTYATTRPATLVIGHGISAGTNGLQTARALHCLIPITGNLDVPGGHRRQKPYPGYLGYWDFIRRPEFRQPREIEEQRIGAAEFPLWCGPDGWAQACHNPSVIEAMLTGRPYPVRALYVSGVNPVVTYPDTEKTIRAFQSLDFLAVATSQMTPTAELADLVLPKTMILEESEAFYQGGMPGLTVVQPAVPRRGETRTDHEIAGALMDRLIARGLVDRDYLPWRDHRGFLDYQLKETDLTFEELCERGWAMAPVEYRAYEREGFKTPTGKVELYSTLMAKHGADPLPDYREPAHAPTPEFPLRLMTGVRSIVYNNSKFRDHAWARKVAPDPIITVHPEVAAGYGLAEDDWVFLETQHGRTKLKLKLADTLQADTVTTGMGWWYPERDGIAGGSLEGTINGAVSYGPPYDRIVGIPDISGLPCRLARVE